MVGVSEREFVFEYIAGGFRCSRSAEGLHLIRFPRASPAPAPPVTWEWSRSGGHCGSRWPGRLSSPRNVAHVTEELGFLFHFMLIRMKIVTCGQWMLRGAARACPLVPEGVLETFAWDSGRAPLAPRTPARCLLSPARSQMRTPALELLGAPVEPLSCGRHVLTGPAGRGAA